MSDVAWSILGIGLWSLFFHSLGRIPDLERAVRKLLPALRERAEEKSWEQFAQGLLGLEQTLQSGWVPTEAQWAAIACLGDSPDPEGIARLRDALRHLRTQGVALLPALGRARHWALFMSESLRNARVRGIPALAQSWILIMALPLAAGALNHALPELKNSHALWWGGASVLWCWTLLGAHWIRKSVRRASRGGLRVQEERLPLGAALGIEAFASALESGHPADIAWSELRIVALSVAPDLSSVLPVSVFAESAQSALSRPFSLSAQQIHACLQALHHGLYVSVMEGRPCAQRADHAARALRDEVTAQRERAFGALATRLLGPLIVCGAIPWLALLAWALSLAGRQLWEGGFAG